MNCLFGGLRSKLMLSYVLVTVATFLAVEILILSTYALVTSMSKTNLRSYLQDVEAVLYPQADKFLQPGQVDQAGLQSWLDGIYASGYASLPPADPMDSPAAGIVASEPMVVLSPDGVVLAQSPAGSGSLVGQVYDASADPQVQERIDSALDGTRDVIDQSIQTRQGDYWLAMPVYQSDWTSDVVGVILVTVGPPQAKVLSTWLLMLAIVLITAVVLVVAVMPLGALFGFVTSRGLARRLKAITRAADAWGEGDFQAVPVDRGNDEIGYLAGRMRHMAEQTQLLLQSQHELAMLEERNRLARDLHDTVKQQIFATLMQVRAAENLLEKDPSQAAKHLLDAENLIKSSQEELGQIISELRPAALNDKGLSDAIAAYLAEWSERACIPADYQVQNLRSLPLDVEQTLYRVFQEALSNVARHSRASAVAVDLDCRPEQVVLTVADNGVGFTPVEGENGFGLRSMRERTGEAGGTVEVRSTPGEGTTLVVSIPLAEN